MSYLWDEGWGHARRLHYFNDTLKDTIWAFQHSYWHLIKRLWVSRAGSSHDEGRAWREWTSRIVNGLHGSRGASLASREFSRYVTTLYDGDGEKMMRWWWWWLRFALMTEAMVDALAPYWNCWLYVEAWGWSISLLTLNNTGCHKSQ